MWGRGHDGVDPGHRIRKDAGTRVRELPGWVGYLCGGSLEEGMEEQIAKVERWCLQGASHAHPEGGPAHHPLLPGVSQPPCPGGEKPMGEGSWDLEEGWHPEFLRGVGAGRGGGEPGAGDRKSVV